MSLPRYDDLDCGISPRRPRAVGAGLGGDLGLEGDLTRALVTYMCQRYGSDGAHGIEEAYAGALSMVLGEFTEHAHDVAVDLLARLRAVLAEVEAAG